jgi:hypothetical protein
MNSRLISYLALFVGIISLCYATWLHQHTEALVQSALRQREAELVKALAPQVHGFYVGFGIAESDIPKLPSTLEDLFRPFEKMSEIATPTTKPETNRTPSAAGSRR